jgi:hypothetical protein
MPEISPPEFIRVLVEDALAASSRLLKADTPTHRRELVRRLSGALLVIAPALAPVLEMLFRR